MLLLLGGHTQSTSSWTCSWWGKVLCKICLKCISLYKPCSICHYSDIALRLSHVFFVFANWEVKETRITFNRPFVWSDHMVHVQNQTCWDASCMVGFTKHRTDKSCFALERFCLENLGAMLEYWYTKLSLPLVLLLCAIYGASIGHFWVTPRLCSTVSLCAKRFIWKWVDLHQNELVDRTHLHRNVFAQRLILTRGQEATQKMAY